MAFSSNTSYIFGLEIFELSNEAHRYFILSGIVFVKWSQTKLSQFLLICTIHQPSELYYLVLQYFKLDYLFLSTFEVLKTLKMKSYVDYGHVVPIHINLDLF